MSRGFTLVEILIVVGLIAIVAAIAVPSMLAARRTSQETAAIGALHVYAGAQEQYRKTDWEGDGILEYAHPFGNLCQAAGKNIGLMDRTFADAGDGGGKPHQGYYYADAVSIGGAAIQWTVDFGLGARPAIYDRTGRRSFFVDTKAKVFGSDRNGAMVTALPADPAADGWQLAE